MDVYNLLESVSAWRFGSELPLGNFAVIIGACISLVVARKIISFISGF